MSFIIGLILSLSPNEIHELCTCIHMDKYTQFFFPDTIILLLTRSEVTGASLALTSCPSFPASSFFFAKTRQQKFVERTKDKIC